MSGQAARASFFLATPPPGPAGAAIAVIQITAADAGALEDALAAAGLPIVPVGRAALRDLCGVDTGIVARWTPTAAQVMPHGGSAVLRHIARRLTDAGLRPADPAAEPDPRTVYPEAEDLIEACVLRAVARAASPLSIDALLRQRGLWRAAERAGRGARCDPSERAALERLLEPPTVVLVGPPNIGKSTLTNALARRAVSIVADEPGVTRDHVGVTLTLDGLTVRWIDAPGVRDHEPDPVQRAAVEIGMRVARAADLVLLCRDPGSPFPDPAPLGLSDRPSLRLLLRADLAQPPPHADVTTAAIRGDGLDALAGAVRRALLPDAALSTDRLWRFDPALPPVEPG